jgi:3-methylcrotonyl-CoA carboxylase alpha subunit
MNKKILFNGQEIAIHITKQTTDEVSFECLGKEYTVRKLNDSTLEMRGMNHKFTTEKFHTDGTLQVFVDGLEAYIAMPGKVQSKKQAMVSEGSLLSPMPGKIFKVMKKAGESVKKDEAILIMEAMKMEHTIRAVKEGVIKTIFFKEGEQVVGGAQLCEIE